MPENSGSVRDTRRPPFCFQTLGALEAIRERFDGPRRASALGVYLTLTEVANEEGGADARGGFSASRKRIAAMCGISVDTLDRYVKVFEEIGIIEVERRQLGEVNLPNAWSICDTPSRTDAAPRARAASPEEEKSEKAPSGELVLAQPKQAARKLSQTLVAYFVDESIRLHSAPPRRVTGQVAALVGEMLEEGIAPARISAGIDALLLKRLHPSALPSLVHEAGLPRRPQERRDDGMFSPEAMMADAVQDATGGQR